MEYPKRNIKQEQKITTLQKIERLHPHKMLLYLGMVGSGLLFLFLLTAYTTSLPDSFNIENLAVPKYFMLSTIVLLASSGVVSHLKAAYEQENMAKLRNYFGLTFLLGTAFALTQYLGWKELTDSGIYITGKAAGAYLYIISGLHVIHLLAGMIFLVFMMVQCIITAQDPVKSLIATTNPYEKIKLDLFTAYWHFMDAAWLVLFLYFVFSIA